METSHFIYMRKCDQLIGFRGTSNSRMAFSDGGQIGGLMGGKEVYKTSPGSVEYPVFVAVCVTGVVGSGLKASEGGMKMLCAVPEGGFVV